MSKQAIRAMLAAGDHSGLRRAARGRPWRVLRFLVGRLYSAETDEKARAVAALGHVVQDPHVVDAAQVTELLRRFLWAMNDESGAVPFGIPEAMGEVLLRRPEFAADYVPILGSFLTAAEMSQTGPIEVGLIWALGRIGALAPQFTPEGVAFIQRAARHHPNDEARAMALWAVTRW